MTRIIAGSAGGRRLSVPRGSATRPTTDRAREAVFATLQGLLDLAGRRVLDLYAGSGALGLEALSRGAGHALLVESAIPALAALRRNVAALGLVGAEIRSVAVERLAAGPPPPAPYHLVFADPPYPLPSPSLAAVLADLVGHGWLAPDAVLVLERPVTAERPPPAGPGFPWPAPLRPVAARRYGEAMLWYGRRP